jgi:protein phosphatase
MPLAASGVTHQGRRSTNEDAWLVDQKLGLLVVADGMGGHNAGEVASALAVKSIQESVRTRGAPPSADVLEEAVGSANDRILSEATAQPEQVGMGTTVVVALVVDGRVLYMSVGDSRIYLFQDGRLVQLTRDDSWLAAALQGDEPAEGLGAHPMRHVLTKVVGLRPDLQATAAECSIRAGDSLLLCTDGVHGAVPHELLTEILARSAPVADLAQDIVRAAIAHGATDNATAIVARLASAS